MKNAASARRSVRQRAEERCEYCDLAQSNFPLVSFLVEPVVAKQHGGSDDRHHMKLQSQPERITRSLRQRKNPIDNHERRNELRRCVPFYFARPKPNKPDVRLQQF